MGERIDDRQAFDAVPILQILGEEMRAFEPDGGSEQKQSCQAQLNPCRRTAS
jgi:hypothetical protein